MPLTDETNQTYKLRMISQWDKINADENDAQLYGKYHREYV